MIRLHSTLLTLLMLLGIGAQQSFAQKSNYPKALWLGVHGGAQASRMSFSPNVSQHMHLGQWGGLMLRYDVEKGASLQLELNYSASGWKEKYDDESQLAYSRHLQYVEMPLLGHLYLGGEGARVFIGGGPVVGWLVGESSAKSGTSFSTFAEQRHGMEAQRRFFWGLAFAPGISLRLAGRHRLELEGRFTLGYSDIWSSARTDPYGQSSPMRFGLGLSYLYRL